MAKAKNPSMIDSAKTISNEMYKMGRSLYLFGLGTVATAEDEVRGVYDRMISRGEDFEQATIKAEDSLVAKASDRAKEIGRYAEDKFQGAVAETLARAGVPSRNEVQTLILRVEQLTEKVDALGAAG